MESGAAIVSGGGSSARRGSRSQAQQRARAREPRGYEVSAAPLGLGAHVFSSFLSSLKKRQSVPWAMIFCGLDLIMPTSRSRSA